MVIKIGEGRFGNLDGIGGSFFLMAVVGLERVGQFEESVAGRCQLRPLFVGQTLQHQLAFLYFTLHVLVHNTINLDLALYFFPAMPVGLVGKSKWYREGDQCCGIVLRLFNAGFQLCGSPPFGIVKPKAVPCYVEQQQAQKRYGSQSLQCRAKLTFFNKVPHLGPYLF